MLEARKDQPFKVRPCFLRLESNLEKQNGVGNEYARNARIFGCAMEVCYVKYAYNVFLSRFILTGATGVPAELLAMKLLTALPK